jgi:hypothetical protein
MIRTEAVQMTTIQGVSFKQKLTAGGAGITIITADEKAVFTINKRDGSCVPFGIVDGNLFTSAVIDEALSLTQGLPYKRMGTISKVYPDNRFDETSVELEDKDEKAEIDVMASVEYKEFIAQYTDKNGKFSYQLMNKELMQFAGRSSIVRRMLDEKDSVDNIVRYIVKSKAADLARNRGMEDDMLTAFIDTLDSMDTRSVFKELTAYLRSRMSRKRR